MYFYQLIFKDKLVIIIFRNVYFIIILVDMLLVMQAGSIENG